MAPTLRDARPTWTCHECAAREMNRSEYVTHLAMVHNVKVRIRAFQSIALAVIG